MSDDERDYYSNSESDEEGSVSIPNNKKPVIINAAKKFGSYIEDDETEDESEAEPDDADIEEYEQFGGVEDEPYDDEEEEEDDQIVKKDEVDDDDNDDAEPDELEQEDDDNDDEIEINEEGIAVEKPLSKTKPKKTTQLIIADEDEDEDENEENYLQKFDNEINKNYIVDFHPECLNHNSDEVSKLSRVIRDENNIIIDPLHRTIPYLTKYEKARVLGQRAK